ncbi:MAG: hypothetical protein FWF96_00845 [Kiritimatiellaeota bacterium]|nr:hypothetical protein [Kiritimatiellota bacterium]
MRDAFTRAFGVLLGEECRRVPGLRKKSRPRWRFAWLFSVLLSITLTVIVTAPFVNSAPFPPRVLFHYGAVVSSCWCVLFIVLRKSLCRGVATYPPVLFHFPVDAEEHRARTRRELLKIPWMFGSGFFITLSILAVQCGAPAGMRCFALAAVLTLLATTAAWAAAMWLARLVSTRNFWILFCAALAVWFVAATGMRDAGPVEWIYRQIESHGGVFMSATPSGWAVAALGAGLHALPPVGWFAWVPLTALAASFPFALRCLERHYGFEKFLQKEVDWEWASYNNIEFMAEKTVGKTITTIIPPTPGPRRAEPSAGAIEKTDDLQRGWEPAFDTPRMGWMERLFVRWLTPDEKAALELVNHEPPRWTRWTRNVMGVWLASAAVAPVVFLREWTAGMGLLPVTAAFVLMGAFFVVLVTVFPPFHFFNVLDGNVFLYPFSFRDYVAVKQKAALTRAMVAAPVYLATGCLAAWAMKEPVWKGALAVFNLLLMATLGMPHVTLRPPTHDSRQVFGKRFCHFFASLAFFVALAASFFMALSVSLAPDTPWWFCACVPIFIVVCRAWERYSDFIQH